jgi:quercetin dioxygenase-like cupin family protein
MYRLTIFGLLMASSLIGPVIAEGAESAGLPAYTKTPQEWAAIGPTGGVGGSGNAKVEVVTILGDPSRPGPYSQLLKVQPHASIAAHHHAGDRVGTVLKGTWRFGYGDSFDAAKLRTMPVGSIYTEPSNAPHYAMTGDEPVVVLITGFGPTDTTYENPADDPTKK